MTEPARTFLGLEGREADPEHASAVLLPVPWEGGISWGAGAAAAPDAIIEASHHLEIYDEELKTETSRAGIATLEPLPPPGDPAAPPQAVRARVGSLLAAGKYVVVVGGDHSVTPGAFAAMHDAFPGLGAVQFDAHSDLRDRYDGSPHSHACAMARVREITDCTLHLGIRSLTAACAERIRRERIPVGTVEAIRTGAFDLDAALDALPERVYLTIDLDGFDWSVIRSTGTPEPGGFTWEEALGIFRRLFARKDVVGFDVVELAADPADRNSAFAAAKLIYRLLGYRLSRIAHKFPDGRALSE